MKSNPLCCTVVQAAEKLGISRTKAYDLIHSHQIPYIRIGRRILIPIHELENWLHMQSTSGMNQKNYFNNER